MHLKNIDMRFHLQADLKYITSKQQYNALHTSLNYYETVKHQKFPHFNKSHKSHYNPQFI